MGKDADVYRLEVIADSKLQLFYSSLFNLLLIASVWQWPYYTPDSYKIAICIFIFFLLFVQLRKIEKNKTDSVLSINTAGRLVHYSKYKVAGWLLNSSRDTFGVYTLNYRREVDNKKGTVIIYWDQLADVDKRRLSRIINKIKYTN